MEIFLNNETREISSDKKLTQLLEDLQLKDKKGIAVAVNNTVVPKANWSSYALQHQDKVVVIRATQGG